MTKSTLIISILVAGLAFHSFARAGTEGHGGNVLVCLDSDHKIQSVDFFDHYEGRTLRKLEPDLGPSDLKVEAKVEYVLSRLAEVNPSRASLYRTWAADFMSEATFVHGQSLGGIPDSGPTVFPKNCQIEQLAIQRSEAQRFPGDSRYLVNGDLWELLGADGRAGLILHEIIYREAIANDHENSLATRFFNETISSRAVTSMKPMEYLRMIQQLVRFSTADYFGVNLEIRRKSHPSGWEDIEFELYPNGNIRGALPASDAQLTTRWGSAHVTEFVDFSPAGRVVSTRLSNGEFLNAKLPTGEVKVGGDLRFTENGELASYTRLLDSVHLVGKDFDFTQLTAAEDRTDYQVDLSSAGYPISYVPVNPQVSKALVNGEWCLIQGISLFETGKIKELTLPPGQYVTVLGTRMSPRYIGFTKFGGFHKLNLDEPISMVLNKQTKNIDQFHLSPDGTRITDVWIADHSAWGVGMHRNFWGNWVPKYEYRFSFVHLGDDGLIEYGVTSQRLSDSYETVPGVSFDPNTALQCLWFNKQGQITRAQDTGCGESE